MLCKDKASSASRASRANKAIVPGGPEVEVPQERERVNRKKRERENIGLENKDFLRKKSLG